MMETVGAGGRLWVWIPEAAGAKCLVVNLCSNPVQDLLLVLSHVPLAVLKLSLPAPDRFRVSPMPGRVGR